jgi:predicted MFS family arabinose efflux permease
VRVPPERTIILLVAAVQFVNVLDFMMVMPLGPDFATALGIPTSHIGMIGGSYTLAAAVAGVAGSSFLDRFDRRKALAVAMSGLFVATFAGGLATGLYSLIAARVLAGAFGGPATALSIAIVSDTVPPERRGRAMGAVMGSFSVASVFGVPAGLELARHLGWRAPFFGVALLSAVVTTIAVFLMPSMKKHLERARSSSPAREFASLLGGVAPLSLAATFLTMLGIFSVIPNLSAYLQYNLGYPRERLWMLYLVGGSASFVTMLITGKLVDRFGAFELVVAGTALHLSVLIAGFIHPLAGVPVLLIFTGFMLSGSVRMVPMGSLNTRVPRPEQRASFMSAQSAVQHAGSALGALLSSFVLVSAPSGRLGHMEVVAWGALTVACVVPFLAKRIEAGVRERERAENSVVPPLATPAPSE